MKVMLKIWMIIEVRNGGKWVNWMNLGVGEGLKVCYLFFMCCGWCFVEIE